MKTEPGEESEAERVTDPDTELGTDRKIEPETEPGTGKIDIILSVKK